MREIKFRVWRPEMKRFRYFDLSTGFNTENYDKFPPVMQYTGLKDKNGVDVYESDVALGFNGELVGQINWSGEDCAFIFNSSSGAAMLNPDYINNFEIIGNIYEHIHLIKEGK